LTTAVTNPTANHETSGQAVPEQSRRPGRRTWNGSFAYWIRWLHIYLSMFGFAALFFFAVTGVTLNHPDWFYSGAESVVDSQGEMPVSFVAVPEAEPDDDGAAASDPARLKQLEIVEHLRSQHAIHGAVAEIRADELEATVAFKGPGYSADVVIDRETGHYELAETRHGFVAVINDLHKGRDTGAGWSWVVDLSAVLMTVVSVTGFVLLFYLKRRLAPGLVVAAGGTVAVVAVFVLLVP